MAVRPAAMEWREVSRRDRAVITEMVKINRKTDAVSVSLVKKQ